MSSTTCPVFRPSLEEFCNFSKYIDRIEKSIGDAGICKIIPPDGWCKQKTEKELENVYKKQNIVIGPIKQCVSGLRGVYQLGLLEAKKMSVPEFRQMAIKSEPDTDWSLEEVERAFWRSMGPLAPAPLYGADLLGSLFDDDDPASGWNLSRLDNMIKLLPSNLPGITTAMLYFGMWRAMFAFHTEDMNLYSINFLHTGKPKSWYSIPPNQARRFESMAQSLHPQGFRGCTQYLRHKTTMFSPKVLRDYGIPFHTVVQMPGEFVITFPASYHAGFNHGFNCAEATNFTTDRWIPKGLEAKVCRCQPYSVSINMTEFSAKLAAKRQHDEELMSEVTSAAKRKKMQTRLSYTGWLDWQKKVEQEEAEAEAQAKAEKARLLEERRRLKRQHESLLLRTTTDTTAAAGGGIRAGMKRKLGGLSLLEEAVALRDPSLYQGAGLLAWENGDGDDEVVDWQSEAWEFRCHCGVRCSNTDPEESWPKGAMFQCVGCDMWCHTQCIYSSDTPPQEQPFCHVCLASMLKLQGQDAVKRETGPVPPAPLHTGRSIRAKSRVLVCAGPYGLSEGMVKDIGEGNKARVYFKARVRGPYGGVEEWIDVSSNRFLSFDHVVRALQLMKPLKPITAQDALVIVYVKPDGTPAPTYESGKRYQTAHKRGLPLPDGGAAVSYAKFMKERHQRHKHIQQAMLAPGGHGPAPGTYYPRFAKQGQVFSYASEDEDDEEEEEEIFEAWERHMQRHHPNPPQQQAPSSSTASGPIVKQEQQQEQQSRYARPPTTIAAALQQQHVQRYALAAAASSSSWPGMAPPHMFHRQAASPWAMMPPVHAPGGPFARPSAHAAYPGLAYPGLAYPAYPPAYPRTNPASSLASLQQQQQPATAPSVTPLSTTTSSSSPSEPPAATAASSSSTASTGGSSSSSSEAATSSSSSSSSETSTPTAPPPSSASTAEPSGSSSSTADNNPSASPTTAAASVDGSTTTAGSGNSSEEEGQQEEGGSGSGSSGVQVPLAKADIKSDLGHLQLLDRIHQHQQAQMHAYQQQQYYYYQQQHYQQQQQQHYQQALQQQWRPPVSG